MARRPIGKRAMTGAERQQRWRDRRALERAKRELAVPGTDDLRRHIEALCERTGVTQVGAVFAPNRRAAYAIPEQLAVALPAIRGDVSYAVCLHEIGHCLGRAQTGSEIAREVGAWRWAREHALIWTSAMERRAKRALAGYSLAWSPQTMRSRKPGSAVAVTPQEVAAARRAAKKARR